MVLPGSHKLYKVRPANSTEDMMQPCLVYLHVISLVDQGVARTALKRFRDATLSKLARDPGASNGAAATG